MTANTTPASPAPLPSAEREAGIRELARKHAEERRQRGWVTGGGIDYPGLLIDAVALLDAARGECDRHRERANEAVTAWEVHQDQDCALKCAFELEHALGTKSPTLGAHIIRELYDERDALRAELAEARRNLQALTWEGAGSSRPVSLVDPEVQ